MIEVQETPQAAQESHQKMNQKQTKIYLLLLKEENTPQRREEDHTGMSTLECRKYCTTPNTSPPKSY